MDAIVGIYCISNKINGKMYIGQSRNIIERWKSHIYELNKGIHRNRYLQYSWFKYGESNFNFSIIELCDIESLDKKEIYYISKYQSTDSDKGYNLTGGGQNIVGESSKKLREILRYGHRDDFIPINQFSIDGKFIKRYDAMTIASEALGISHSSAIRNCANKFHGSFDQGSKTCCGYAWIYDEDIEKFLSTDYSKWFSIEPKFHIYKYEYPSGIFVCEYNTVSDAAIDNNVSNDVISMCLRGVQLKSGKYTYRRSTDNEYGKNIQIVIPKHEKKNKRKVVAVAVDSDEILYEFDSIVSAANALNYKTSSHISGCCNGKRKTYKSMRWFYREYVNIISSSDGRFFIA